MPSKETLKLPTIDVARTRGKERVRAWNPPLPSFDRSGLKLNHFTGERKRPFRISLRPKYEHHDPDTQEFVSDMLETRSLPPLLVSRNPDRSVSIKREGRGDLAVGNSFPAPQSSEAVSRPKPDSSLGNPFPLEVKFRPKRRPLLPIENIIEPKSVDNSFNSADSDSWSQSLSQGLLLYEENLNKQEMERYLNAPFKSDTNRFHPRGQAPPKPEQVLVPSRRHNGCISEGCDGEYHNDWEWENLYNSITLPRIEAVLRSEGIKPKSISEQISKIKERCRRHEYTIPPNARPKVRPKPPEQFKPLRQSDEKVTLDSVIESTTKSMADFLGDIEQTRWLSYQQIERGQFGKEFLPPRIVLLSSNVPGCIELLDKVIKKDKDVLTICYDFEKATYEALIDEMKKRLNEYKEGCRARSMLLFCQGGPGYLYMLKKRVVTPQKIVKGEQTDLLRFWREVGEMMSRLHPEEAFVHVMGCDLLGNKQGSQLFKELKKLVKPNTVHFESPKPGTTKGRTSMGHYLDLVKYDAWIKKDDLQTEDIFSSDVDTDAAIFAVSSHNAPDQLPAKSQKPKLTSKLDSIGEQDVDTEANTAESNNGITNLKS